MVFGHGWGSEVNPPHASALAGAAAHNEQTAAHRARGDVVAVAQTINLRGLELHAASRARTAHKLGHAHLTVLLAALFVARQKLLGNALAQSFATVNERL